MRSKGGRPNGASQGTNSGLIATSILLAGHEALGSRRDDAIARSHVGRVSPLEMGAPCSPHWPPISCRHRPRPRLAPDERRAHRFCYSRASCGTAFALLCALTAALSSPAMAETNPDDDPYLWLEDVQGERALAWVRERNADSRKVLEAWPGFAEHAPRASSRCWIRATASPTSRAAAPGSTTSGRTPSTRAACGAAPRWPSTARRSRPGTLVLDLDALGRERRRELGLGRRRLPAARTTALPGDAVARRRRRQVVREFDLVDAPLRRRRLHAARGQDRRRLARRRHACYVGTDFGPGSLTDSGYPRIIKRWRRGQPLAQASTVFEAQAQRRRRRRHRRPHAGLRAHAASAARSTSTTAETRAAAGRPAAAARQARRRAAELLARPRAARAAQRLDGGGAHLAAAARCCWRRCRGLPGRAARLHALFTPTATRSLAGFTTTRTHVLLDMLDNVASRLEEWRSRTMAAGAAARSRRPSRQPSAWQPARPAARSTTRWPRPTGSATPTS